MGYNNVPNRIKAVDTEIGKIDYEINKVKVGDNIQKYVEVSLTNYRLNLSGAEILSAMLARRAELLDEMSNLKEVDTLLTKVAYGLLQ